MKGGVPTESQVREWLHAHPGRSSSRELARAFGVRGHAECRALQELIRRIRDAKDSVRRDQQQQAMVARIVRLTTSGELVAIPEDRQGLRRTGELIASVPASRRRHPQLSSLGVGDRVLVRLDTASGSRRTGQILARVQRHRETFTGVVIAGHDGGIRVQDCARKSETTRKVEATEEIAPGDVVLCSDASGGRQKVRVLERLGSIHDPRCIPVMVAAQHGIPARFDSATEREADACGPPADAARADLTDLPFITVDGEDARDFDDAVAATARPDGGFHVIVAIADVAHYVRPGSALDRSARTRGNSVYVPGHVFPMLPPALSGGWCSLMPDELRGAVVVELHITANGRLEHTNFQRALIRSRARVTYEQLEDAALGSQPIRGVRVDLVDTLYAAFRLLRSAREQRGALDIKTAEPRIRLDPLTGEATEFTLVSQLDSHRLIEEFMVLANAAVAEHLASREVSFLYRVHAEPRPAKIRSLQDDLLALTGRRQVLAGRAPVLRFNEALARANGTATEHAVHLAVLRAQSQAEYASDNIGHFGLGIPRYTHFTSPIRRYSDLTVHRALLRTLGLEPGPHPGDDELASLGQELSIMERRATAAEREACQRLATRFLSRTASSAMIGDVISVEKYGAFVRLRDSGIEGLLPISALGSGYFRFNPRARRITSERSGETFSPGDTVMVSLYDADPIRGRVAFRRAKVEPRA